MQKVFKSLNAEERDAVEFFESFLHQAKLESSVSSPWTNLALSRPSWSAAVSPEVDLFKVLCFFLDYSRFSALSDEQQPRKRQKREITDDSNIISKPAVFQLVCLARNLVISLARVLVEENAILPVSEQPTANLCVLYNRILKECLSWFVEVPNGEESEPTVNKEFEGSEVIRKLVLLSETESSKNINELQDSNVPQSDHSSFQAAEIAATFQAQVIKYTTEEFENHIRKIDEINGLKSTDCIKSGILLIISILTETWARTKLIHAQTANGTEVLNTLRNFSSSLNFLRIPDQRNEEMVCNSPQLTALFPGASFN